VARRPEIFTVIDQGVGCILQREASPIIKGKALCQKGVDSSANLIEDMIEEVMTAAGLEVDRWPKSRIDASKHIHDDLVRVSVVGTKRHVPAFVLGWGHRALDYFRKAKG